MPDQKIEITCRAPFLSGKARFQAPKRLSSYGRATLQARIFFGVCFRGSRRADATQFCRRALLETAAKPIFWALCYSHRETNT